MFGECDARRTAGVARADAHTSWCDRCAVRATHGFADFPERDLELMRSLKVAHGRAWAGETVIAPGAGHPCLLTLYSGCAVRYRTLSSGDRQLLNVVLPGDLLGLESVMTGASCYLVQAVTDVTFCTLDARRFDELLAHPTMARRILAIVEHDQRKIAERLAVVGACDAPRNLAHFICELHSELLSRGAAQSDSFKLPLSLRQLAEALGLTTAHLHRVLSHLREEGVLSVESDKSVRILDQGRLRQLGTHAEAQNGARYFL